MQLTLEKAKEILPRYTTEAHLFTHAQAVSACMEAMADYFHEDRDHWAAIGYLHDVDYEKYPDEHCHHVHEILDPEGIDNADQYGKESHHRGRPLRHHHGLCPYAPGRHEWHEGERAEKEIQG